MRRSVLTIPVASLLLLAACGEDAIDHAPLQEATQTQLVAEAPAVTVAAGDDAASTLTLDSPTLDVAVAAGPAVEAPRLAEVTRLPVAETFGAVGMRVSEVDGAFTVAEAIADMPAAKAGIEEGDQVVAIDGMSTDMMSLAQFIDLVRGEPGVGVTLTVIGADGERDVTLERDALTVERNRCERIQDMRRDTEFGGIGVRLSMTEGCGGDVFVRSIEDGMPAQAAGLQAGDRIVSVDGLDAAGAHVWDVVDVLRGEPGTTVLVGVEDAQGVARAVELERVNIALPEASGCR